MEAPRYLIKEHVFDQNIQYEAGDFSYHRDKDKGIYSTMPHLGESSCPQKAYKVASKTLKEYQEEKVLKKLIPGKDGRELVADTTRYPYRIHAQLEMEFPGGLYGGSGSMIGRHHLLTCAHNVYDTEKNCWVKKIEIHPGKNKSCAPYGMAKATRAYIFQEWATKGDAKFDIALVILDKPLGQSTGWGGICSSKDDSLIGEKFHITGYPGDKNFDEMWTMSNTVKQIHPEMFDYEIDTAPGQSGSAIWSDKWGQPMIVGVHTRGSNIKNSGVRITEGKFTEMFAKIMSQTFVLKEGLSLSLSELHLEIPTTQMTFGATEWEKHFGKIGVAPSLPSNIKQILESSSVIWPNKKVKDTHHLVLIPGEVSRQVYQLDTLEKLAIAKKVQFVCSEEIKSKVGAIRYPPHWILMTHQFIPGSENKTFAEQRELLNKYPAQNGFKYSLPTLMEASTVLRTYQEETKKPLLFKNLKKDEIPLSATRCLEGMISLRKKNVMENIPNPNIQEGGYIREKLTNSMSVMTPLSVEDYSRGEQMGIRLSLYPADSALTGLGIVGVIKLVPR